MWSNMLVIYIQVHLKKIEYREKVIFSCNLFQKVKHFKSFFVLILMIRAHESQKLVSQIVRIYTF